jgi:hypothetical protein
MRFLRSLWFPPIVAVILLVGWYLWGLDWLAERRWQEYATEARARGVKFSLAELRLPRVAEAEDLFQSAVFRVAANGQPSPYDNLLRRPPPFDWTKDKPALPDWAKTRKTLKEQKFTIDPKESDDFRAIQGVLKEYQPLVDALVKNQAKAANWDDMWSAGVTGFANSSAQINGPMVLLASQAAIDLTTGDVARARTLLEAFIRLRKSMEHAPALVAQVIRMSADVRFQLVLGYGMERGIWRDQDLQELGEYCISRNGIRQHKWALETERAIWAEFCDQYRGDAAAILGPAGSAGKMLQHFRASRTRWWRNNELWLQRFFDEELARLSDPLEQRSWVGPRNFDPHAIHEESPETMALAWNVAVGIRGIGRSAIFTHAMNKMAGIACALELHRREHGEYPEQLEELVPKFLPSLPSDPCGGKPLRYRREGKGDYYLYSVGANFRDDGGTKGAEPHDPDWRWWAPRAK